VIFYSAGIVFKYFMSIDRENFIEEISRQFQIYGEILHAEPCKIGHINETFAATYAQGGTRVRYIHQKINQNVFKDPESLMENVTRVTSHIREKLFNRGERDVTRKALTLVPARDGRPFHRNGDGDYWRTFFFVEGAQTFEAVQTPAQAFQAGCAFGNFQSLLVDLPGKRLAETIPAFHNTRNRFEHFRQAVAADHCNRAQSATREIQFALQHEDIVDVLLNALANGQIPERITHNDTKFNNVMLDNESGCQICVLDLDTVMPGLVLYDFGDMVRTTTSPTLEDERDLTRIQMQMPMFEALARGYLEAAGSFLTPAEKALLAFSGKLITFTIGLRFLTDYLAGDKYFRVHRPEHNLDRCRTQFKLIESIEQQEEAMQNLIDRI
jgi:aminoglycoside phosphotransferase (APT) family kinase protein